jgi:hypothetical protein
VVRWSLGLEGGVEELLGGRRNFLLLVKTGMVRSRG